MTFLQNCVSFISKSIQYKAFGPTEPYPTTSQDPKMSQRFKIN